jgi:hypothetical protein
MSEHPKMIIPKPIGGSGPVRPVPKPVTEEEYRAIRRAARGSVGGPASEPTTTMVVTFNSAADRQLIHEAARAADLSTAEWMRRAIAARLARPAEEGAPPMPIDRRPGFTFTAPVSHHARVKARAKKERLQMNDWLLTAALEALASDDLGKRGLTAEDIAGIKAEITEANRGALRPINLDRLNPYIDALESET